MGDGDAAGARTKILGDVLGRVVKSAVIPAQARISAPAYQGSRLRWNDERDHSEAFTFSSTTPPVFLRKLPGLMLIHYIGMHGIFKLKFLDYGLQALFPARITAPLPLGSRSFSGDFADFPLGRKRERYTRRPRGYSCNPYWRAARVCLSATFTLDGKFLFCSRLAGESRLWGDRPFLPTPEGCSFP